MFGQHIFGAEHATGGTAHNNSIRDMATTMGKGLFGRMQGQLVGARQGAVFVFCKNRLSYRQTCSLQERKKTQPPQAGLTMTQGCFCSCQPITQGTDQTKTSNTDTGTIVVQDVVSRRFRG